MSRHGSGTDRPPTSEPAPGVVGQGPHGFTLMELVLVTVVLGILVMTALPQLRKTTRRAHVAAAKSDLHNLIVAEESYFSDHGAYTDDLGELDFQASEGISVEIRLPGAGGGGGGPGGGPPPGAGPPPGGGSPGGGGAGDPSAGWSARAVTEAAGDTCAVFFGSAGPYAPAEKEGLVTCGS